MKKNIKDVASYVIFPFVLATVIICTPLFWIDQIIEFYEDFNK